MPVAGFFIALTLLGMSGHSRWLTHVCPTRACMEKAVQHARSNPAVARIQVYTQADADTGFVAVGGAMISTSVPLIDEWEQ